MSESTTADYATLLEQARIAALKALTDILATSDDPKERRLAATAILRTPDPKPPSEQPKQCRRFAAVRRGNRPSTEETPQAPKPQTAAKTPPQWTDPLSGVMNREQLLQNVDSPAIRPHAIPYHRRRAAAELISDSSAPFS